MDAILTLVWDVDVDDLLPPVGYEATMAVINLMFCVLVLIINPLLIHGARRERRVLLLPWMIMFTCYLIFR